jgi:hypothetical protein
MNFETYCLSRKNKCIWEGKKYISNQFSYFNGQILLPNLSYAPNHIWWQVHVNSMLSKKTFFHQFKQAMLLGTKNDGAAHVATSDNEMLNEC